MLDKMAAVVTRMSDENTVCEYVDDVLVGDLVFGGKVSSITL